MTTSSLILNFLKNNKQRFESEYKLTQIGLFGSLARGEQTKDSDIDIIVEFRPHTEDLHELKARLKKEIQEVIEASLEQELARMKVVDLRKLAYQMELTSLSKKEIKFANKKALIDAIQAEKERNDK